MAKETKSTKKSDKYRIENNTFSRGSTCPKCGPGVFMANHKDRYHCGKCNYMEKKSLK